MTRCCVVDWRGVTLELDAPPSRVVSLVPSVTDTLFALGVGDRVVGVTEYCVHPEDGVRDLPKLGGTKNPDVERIVELAPDLVLMNAEENRPIDVERIEAHARVHVSLPRTVDDCAASILEWGHVFGAESEARKLAAEIEDAKRRALAKPMTRSPRVAYLVWWKPIIVAGSATYIDDLIRTVGGVNAFGDHEDRYPRISEEDLVRAMPDGVLLSSEPYEFGASEREILRSFGLRSETGAAAQIRFVDGELGSWHGARTARGIRHLGSVIAESMDQESVGGESVSEDALRDRNP